MATKKQLVDLDFSSASKILQLPAATASGHAVRYDEFNELDGDVSSLISLTGVAENASHFGTFTGSTISDNSNLKDALQELEVAAESNQLEVAAGSTAFLSISQNEISISSLAITDVTVDSTHGTLAAYLTANASHGLQAGDVLVLANAANSLNRSYIHNGGSDSTDANNFTRLQTDITPANVRGYFSGGDALAYDSATGDFDVNVDDSSIEVSSDALRVKADGIKLSHVDFGTDAGQIDAGDIPLQTYSWSRITNPADLQDAVEKLDADVAAVIAGGDISLNNGAATNGEDDGSVDVRVDSVGIEINASNNLQLKDLGVATAKLAADAVTGAKIADDAVDSEHITAQAVDFAHFNSAAICSDFSSCGSNQVARADTVKAYIDGRSYMRMSSEDVDLVAGTDLTITHNLGNKYVTLSVYDSSDKLMDVEVTLLTANTLKLKATVNAADSKVIIVG